MRKSTGFREKVGAFCALQDSFSGGLLPLPGAPDGCFLVLGTFFSNCGGDVLIDGVMKLSDKTVGGPANALKCGRTDVKNSGVVVIKNGLRYYIIAELYAPVSRA